MEIRAKDGKGPLLFEWDPKAGCLFFVKIWKYSQIWVIISH